MTNPEHKPLPVTAWADYDGDVVKSSHKARDAVAFSSYSIALTPLAEATLDLDELRRALCAIDVVGEFLGKDTILRESVLDVLDHRVKRVAASDPAVPVAWRHSLTHCLYETEEEVPLSDGDSWAEPLYLAGAHPAQPEAPAVAVPPMLTDAEILAVHRYANFEVARAVIAERDKQWIAACGVKS